MSKPRLPTHTLDHAKRLRKGMTDAERRLRQYLRAGRLEGMKFRRQHPVPPYIVDFCCVEVLSNQLHSRVVGCCVMDKFNPKSKQCSSIVLERTLYCGGACLVGPNMDDDVFSLMSGFSHSKFPSLFAQMNDLLPGTVQEAGLFAQH